MKRWSRAILKIKMRMARIAIRACNVVRVWAHKAGHDSVSVPMQLCRNLNFALKHRGV